MDKSLEFLLNKIEKNSTLVCAVSGGPDSMVLLNLLLKVKESLNLTIVCAHVNHKLRKESEKEEKFIKKYSKEKNILLECTSFSKYETTNIESEAHNRRYEFFNNVVKKYNAKYLLTAHHGDDLIETVLMKLTRGSSLSGYKGFDIELDLGNYKILRPLVFYTKNSILEYAKDNDIFYFVDETNFSDKYTRNRYRKKVLPFLKSENENIHLKYLDFNKELSNANEFIEEVVSERYNALVVNETIDVKLFLKEKRYIQEKIIYKFLKEIYNKNINLISQKHIDFIIGTISSTKPNLKINIPNDIFLQKKYNKFGIMNEINLEDYKIKLTNKTKVLNGYIKKVNETKLTNNYVCYLDSSKVKLPLYVRNIRNGDKITLLGLEKDKKVKDIYINEKIDINKRKSYPLVVDSNDEILWIPGIKKSKYDTIKTKKYDIILWYDEEE